MDGHTSLGNSVYLSPLVQTNSRRRPKKPLNMTEAKCNEVKLVVSGDLLFHEIKKVYTAVLTTKVVFYPIDGKDPRVLSTRVCVMSVKSYLDLVKEQPDKVEAMNKELKKITDECPEATWDFRPFMHIDTSKKPHWRHVCGNGRHYADCSECESVQCKCEPGKGAPPSENPHTQAKDVRCWLPAFQ